MYTKCNLSNAMKNLYMKLICNKNLCAFYMNSALFTCVSVHVLSVITCTSRALSSVSLGLLSPLTVLMDFMWRPLFSPLPLITVLR